MEDVSGAAFRESKGVSGAGLGGERRLQRLMCGAQTLEGFEHFSQHFPGDI